ncbi:MAG: DUF2937 family protein [Rhizobiaceae bacterium]|nr:DUF2937 family protein [Rhizobiaceae bacterium]
MSGLFVRVSTSLFAGLIFSQSSEFTQQYVQRLGGAANELAAVVARFDASAAREGLPRDVAVERLKSSADGFVARQGDDAAATIARERDVSRRYDALRAEVPVLRSFAALADPDWPMIARTVDDFRPAIPVTADGLFLTVAGFAGGWALGAGVSGAAGMRRRRKARRAARPIDGSHLG